MTINDTRLALPPLDPNRRYTLDQTIAYLGIGRATLYSFINNGQLATIKERKRRFVPGSEIIRRSTVQAA